MANPPTSRTDYLTNSINQYTLTDTNAASRAMQSLDNDDDGNLDTIYITGDMNCDGLFNGSDIGPFYLALGDPEEYENQYANCNILNGDINGDGLVNGNDIDAFFALLGTGNDALWAQHTWDAENP